MTLLGEPRTIVLYFNIMLISALYDCYIPKTLNGSLFLQAFKRKGYKSKMDMII